jgi:DNA polymerase V
MGFPIPGDAIEQSLDLNQLVIKNSAATFFMRVEGTLETNGDVQPGDLLVVDRSLDARDNALVVAALNGELAVLRVQQVNHQIRPYPDHWQDEEIQFEVWGVVTTIIRSV